MRSTNRQAVIQELRHQLRYANTLEQREVLRHWIDFWMNYVPKN